jgi:hypothetical protein
LDGVEQLSVVDTFLRHGTVRVCWWVVATTQLKEGIKPGKRNATLESRIFELSP